MTSEQIKRLARRTLWRVPHDDDDEQIVTGSKAVQVTPTYREVYDVQRQLIDVLEKRLDQEKTIRDAQTRTIASLEAAMRTHQETIAEMRRTLNREAC
jgi:hypothetical protein